MKGLYMTDHGMRDALRALAQGLHSGSLAPEDARRVAEHLPNVVDAICYEARCSRADFVTKGVGGREVVKALLEMRGRGLE